MKPSTLTTLFTGFFTWILILTPVLAQEIDVETPGEPALKASEKAKAERAIADLRAEIEKIDQQQKAEIASRATEIEAATTEVDQLADRQQELRQALEEIAKEDFKLLEKLDELEAQKEKRDESIAALESETRSQAHDFVERFKGSVFSMERPSLLVAARGLLDDSSLSQEERLEKLLDIFAQAHTAAGSVSTFEADVRLSDAENTVGRSKVLRVGLIGGYYTHPPSGESGMLVVDADNPESLKGRAVGISEDRQKRIAGLVENPTGGGLVPVDVTDGAGLATLQAADSIAAWFEKGGKFMWPLVVVAAFAFLMVVERAIMLTLRSRGIGRHVRKVVDLVRAGRVDEALVYTDKTGGAAGNVLHAALIHSDGDRSVMEDAVQEALLHQSPHFQKRLSFIALCAAVAPLMGLLGTVTGMIATFKAVTLFGTSDPRFMAGGISVALITTQAGLYLAIPCLLCRGVLGAMAESALGKLEAGAISVVLAILELKAEERAQEEPSFTDEASKADKQSGLLAAATPLVTEPAPMAEEAPSGFAAIEAAPPLENVDLENLDLDDDFEDFELRDAEVQS